MGTAYALAGLSIEVTSDDPVATHLLENRLRSLRPAPPRPADITIEITGPDSTTDEMASRGPGRVIYDAAGQSIEYFEQIDQLHAVSRGCVVLTCDPCRGRIRIATGRSTRGDRLASLRLFVTVSLHETLKRFGRFPMHAAGLSVGDSGVLVPGRSGAGKSTLSVALVRAGLEFLSDDTVFLTHGQKGIVAWGLPDEVDVSEETVSMFAELHHLAQVPVPVGREKHSFRIEDLFNISTTDRCRPAALVFPRVEEGPSPLLEALSPAEVLVELMPNVLATEPEATQAHLDILGKLARTVRGYALRPGLDVDAAAASVASLISNPTQ